MKNHKISLSTSESKNPDQVFLDRICDPDVLNANLKKAIEHSWKLGVPVTQQDEKGIYDLYPDGTKKYIDIKDIENA